MIFEDEIKIGDILLYTNNNFTILEKVTSKVVVHSRKRWNTVILYSSKKGFTLGTTDFFVEDDFYLYRKITKLEGLFYEI